MKYHNWTIDLKKRIATNIDGTIKIFKSKKELKEFFPNLKIESPFDKKHLYFVFDTSKPWELYSGELYDSKEKAENYIKNHFEENTDLIGKIFLEIREVELK